MSADLKLPVADIAPETVGASARRAGAFARLGRARNWTFAALLVALTIFAYQPVWNASFIWDDDDYVTQNPLLTAPDGLKRIWFSTDSPSQYFPLVYTTFRLEHALWGLNPAGYHWVNLLLHAANALLLWRVLGRLDIRGAGWAAALFALHPVQVESVAWITELKNVQSWFFGLLALLAWVEFLDARRSRRMYALALVAYAAALLSKTTACTLPVALLLAAWLKGGRLDFRRWLQVAPFVALGLAMGMLTLWWERHQQGTSAEMFDLGLVERGLIATRAVWFYLGKLLWPVDLAFSYPRWTIDAANPAAYAWAVACAAAAWMLWRWRTRLGRSAGAAAIFFVVTLGPLLGFFMLYTFRYAFVADHYQYVAMVGPAALAGAGLARFVAQNRLRAVLGSVVVGLLAVGTWRQSRMYENRETLWETTLQRNPSSHLAHNNLSALHVEQRRPQRAAEHARRAIALGAQGPDLALAHVNLGNAHLQTGDATAAIGHFTAAVAIQPNLADAHNNLGSAYLENGDTEAAKASFRRCLELNPQHASASYNLGNAFYRQGNGPEAIAAYREALRLRPADADVLTNLGTVLAGTGRLEEAAAQLSQAIRFAPNLAPAHNNLGYVRQQQGRDRDAVAHYEEALRLQPENVGALLGLAWLRSTSGDQTVRDPRRAVELARRAQRAAPGDDPLVLHALAAAYSEMGDTNSATAAARQALGAAEARGNAALAENLRSQLAGFEAGLTTPIAP